MRGQYEGYRQTPGVAADSDTETFVALRCEIDNWRWAGVPVLPAHREAAGGRGAHHLHRLPRAAQEHVPAPARASGAKGPDHLTFDLADASKLSLSFYGKKPGPGMNLEKLSLQFALHETGQDADILEAYERLIHDAMVGDHTLFNTAEGIERLWELSTPLLEKPAAGPALRPGIVGTGSIQRAHRTAEVAPALRARLAPGRLSRPSRRARRPVASGQTAGVENRSSTPVTWSKRGTGRFDHVHVAGPGQRHEGGVVAQGHRLLDVVGAERRRHARIGRAVHQVLRNTERQLGRGRTQRVALGDIVGARPP